LEARDNLGIDEGAFRRGMSRLEEEMCEGEKPRTTLVVLRSDIPLAESELTAGEDLSDDASELVDLASIPAGGSSAVAVGVNSAAGISAMGVLNE
jgi:hypothetical protein